MMNAMTSPRHAAVLGGNRIPFARSNGPYATASNQDMLTAALDGLVARFALQGEHIDEVVAGAVLKHARDFNLTRECRARLPARPRPPPPTTSSRRATPASRPRCSWPTRSRSGQIDVGDRRRRRHDLRRAGRPQRGPAQGADGGSTAPRSPAERAKLIGKLRPGQIVPDIPRNAEPRTGLCDGRARRASPRRSGASRARTRTSSPPPATATSPPPTSAASSTTSSRPYLGLERDQNLRPDSSAEKLAKLKPVFGEDEDAR